MDYRAGNDPYATGNTPGLIVDDVCCHNNCVLLTLYQSFPLILQVMHEIMVKYLPRGCRLIALFDVS